MVDRRDLDRQHTEHYTVQMIDAPLITDPSQD